MAEERPSGRRYSFTYLDPGKPVYQSRKLQFRAGSFFSESFSSEAGAVQSHLEAELGLPMLSAGYAHNNVRKFLAESQVSDFLEAVTIIAEALRVKDKDNKYHSDPNRAFSWVTFLQRAFLEENSIFELDRLGGVHPRIDAKFTSERVSGLKGLEPNRYLNAREHFETAHAALDEMPPATNRAIRETFLANEELFKLVCPSASRLEGSEVTRRLVPLLDSVADGAEKDALNGMLRAATHYIAASHSFRHAQGQPDLPPASLETATLMIGSGTALLRWLIWLDGQRQAPTVSV